MLGISNEDVREKLASDILHTVGINCATIDLVYDEELKQNACFSNYILGESEELIAPPYCHSENNMPDKIEQYFQGYAQGICQIASGNIPLEDFRKNYYEYVYMCTIIDSYDLKSDNLPVLHNKLDNTYRPSSWFDFGSAF